MPVERRVEELIEELRNIDRGRESVDSWAGLIRELIEIGPPAVEPVCSALRETNKPWDMRVYGFVLRGIRDPRAVPTLIESIPKTLIPPASDAGYKASNSSLHEFMLRHDVNAASKTEWDIKDSFSVNRPRGEIHAALVAITGHSINEKELAFVVLGGSPAQQYRKRELFHENATMWQSWWELHAQDFNVPDTFRKVTLPLFETEMHSVIDVFSEGGGIVAENRINVIAGPVDTGSDRAFLDLDTGRWARLPASLDATTASVEELDQWARENQYDLYCHTVNLPGNDKPIHAIRPVDMELWQNEVGRFETVDTEIESRVADPGTPIAEYLIWQDPVSQKPDPDKEATFLYRTSEGTCGAIKYVCIIDNVVKPEELRGRTVDDIPPKTYSRPGVRIEYKVFSAMNE